MKLRLTVAVVLTAFVAGCGGGGDEGTATPASGGGGGGEKLFTDNCAQLPHARRRRRLRQGRPRPRPAPARARTSSTPRSTTAAAAMPAFKGKLTDEQIKEIVDYVSDNAGKG